MTPSSSTPTLFVRDLETLRVIADPLRNQILESLIAEPQTVKQVAEKLGLAPSKLYYHVNMLEKYGFIQVEETRMVANMVEKLYRASATNIEVDRSLVSFATEDGKQALNDSVISVLDTTREDLLRSLQARAYLTEQGAPVHPRKALIGRGTSRLSESRADAYVERLQALMAEFEAETPETASPEAQPYALTIAFYPSFYFEKPAED